MTYVIVLLACAVNVGLHVFQNINAVQKRRVFAAFTSIGISCMTLFILSKVVINPGEYAIPYIIGNLIGAQVAMWLDDKIAPKLRE